MFSVILNVTRHDNGNVQCEGSERIGSSFYLLLEEIWGKQKDCTLVGLCITQINSIILIININHSMIMLTIF